MRKPTKNESPIVPELLDVNGVARLFSVSDRQVRKLTAAGILPVFRIGRRCVRYSRADVLAAMQIFRRA